jgi:hypothetical protein
VNNAGIRAVPYHFEQVSGRIVAVTLSEQNTERGPFSTQKTVPYINSGKWADYETFLPALLKIHPWLFSLCFAERLPKHLKHLAKRIRWAKQ